MEHNFPGIGHKIMLLNARRIPAAGEHASLILLAIEDMTEVRKKEREYQETIARLEKELGEARGRGVRWRSGSCANRKCACPEQELRHEGAAE